VGAGHASSPRPYRARFPHPISPSHRVWHMTAAGRPASIHACRPARLCHTFSSLVQKVSFQLLIVPVSEAATSWTRSFQVPLAVSLEASTVYVALTLSAESEVLEAFSA